jgi:hypothetical protein
MMSRWPEFAVSGSRRLSPKNLWPSSVVLTAWLALAGAVVYSWAQEKKPDSASAAQPEGQGKTPPPAEPPSSLDDQLLEDLDNELLKGAGQRPGKPAQAAPQPEGDTPQDDEPDRAADPGATGEDIGEPGEEDPLSRIGRRMRAAEGLIAARRPVRQTVELQQQIVTELAKLIEQLEKQSRNSQSQGSKGRKGGQQITARQPVKQPQAGSGPEGTKPTNKPARDSSQRRDPMEVQRPDMAQMKDLMKDLWGQLPERAREQMLQSPPEQFLPKYELLIEKYYKRLADEQQKSP